MPLGSSVGLPRSQVKMPDYTSLSTQIGEKFGAWLYLTPEEAKKCQPRQQDSFSENTEEEQDEVVDYVVQVVNFGS